MKLLCSLAFILGVSVCIANPIFLSRVGDPPKVIVKNWNESMFLLPVDYWEGSKVDEIVAQIGKKEYEQVVKYSDSRNIPCAFLIFCEDRDGSPKKKLDVLAAKKAKLNVYKIATFTHVNRAGNEYKMAVLSVPYSKNESWDKDVKWDTVYFLIEDKFVEQIQ